MCLENDKSVFWKTEEKSHSQQFASINFASIVSSPERHCCTITEEEVLPEQLATAMIYDTVFSANQEQRLRFVS